METIEDRQENLERLTERGYLRPALWYDNAVRQMLAEINPSAVLDAGSNDTLGYWTPSLVPYRDAGLSIVKSTLLDAEANILPNYKAAFSAVLDLWGVVQDPTTFGRNLANALQPQGAFVGLIPYKHSPFLTFKRPMITVLPSLMQSITNNRVWGREKPLGSHKYRLNTEKAIRDSFEPNGLVIKEMVRVQDIAYIVSGLDITRPEDRFAAFRLYNISPFFDQLLVVARKR